MTIWTSLIEFDQEVFYLLNRNWTNPVFDFLLPVWRDKLFWLPVYFFIISFMVYNFKSKGYLFIVFLLVTVGAADIMSSHVIKKSVERLRPCREPMMTEERVLVPCGSGYSFTSSHATNHFAISMFLIFTLGRRFPKTKWLLFFWAASIAYSQVYVGVHFPLDVVVGSLLGTLVGYIGSTIYRRTEFSLF